MEDIKAYIESGILELYAMGELNPSERAEVEAMVAQYPEIRAELAEIEQSLESYATQHAVAPREILRSTILERMQGSSTVSAETVEEDDHAGIVSITRSGVPVFYKYAFAACLTFLLLSLSSLFVLYTRLQESRQQIAVLQSSNQQFVNKVNFMESQIAENKTVISVLSNPDFRIIDLKGTELAPEASMKVAFNSKAKEVMIDLTALNMPVNDKTHQYQLWAIVDGKPVDLGVFDHAADSTGMLRMKEIANAQTFAVTLEPRGGSANPTLTQLMVAGQI